MKILTIDINGICNLACDFCYQDLDGSELSKKKILDVVKKRPDFGVVEIGGGEPSMHAELADIVQGIVEEERKVHLSTNGVIVPEDFLGLDADTRKNVTVQVSMPAGNKETYLDITGMDCFDTVIANVGTLKEHYTTVLSTVVYQENIHQVSDILQIGYDSGIHARVNLVFPVGKGKNVALLDEEQVDRLKGLLLVEKISHSGMIESPLIHGVNCPALSHAYGFQSREGCPLSSGRKEYYNPKGELRGCEFYHITNALNNRTK